MNDELVKESKEDNTLARKQPFLGNKGLIAFIALMNMFIPLSTDLYLPALPKMSAYFNSNATITNMTLTAFFLFYAVGILFWGPLSDKYGRKKVLLIGSIIYMISSISCALSVNIYFLIGSRIFQGIGAGGITSVSMAIIRDTFSGKKRMTILAICQSISGLAPMLAPVVGAIILQFANWRGAFWSLAIISILNLILTILFKETLKDTERYEGTVFGSIGRLIVVGKNKSFMVPALIFTLSSIPFMGYIAVSSYIYVDYFNLSAQVYSYFFSANALVSIFGPFLYVKFFGKMNKKFFATMIFAVSTLSGILVMTIGSIAPILFWISFVIMSLSSSIMRPFSSYILLEQQKGDAGTVSSLINTLATVLGSVGMFIASLPWINKAFGLGTIITIFSVLALVWWRVFLKSKITCVGIK